MQENEEDGLRIFTEESTEVESWPRNRVLDHLSSFAPQLVIPYLVSCRLDFLKLFSGSNYVSHDSLGRQLSGPPVTIGWFLIASTCIY